MAQVKCKDCGFLSAWNIDEARFMEATECFRVSGKMEGRAGHLAHAIKCFIGKENLLAELGDPTRETFPYATLPIVQKEIMARDRDCDGHVPWMQGFHPKEHQEMMFHDELRNAERRHANLSLSVAVFAAFITAISGFAGAYIAYRAAHLGAEATRESAKWQVEALRQQTEAQLKMTQMQIEAQKEIAKTTPAPQVILRMPPAPAR